MAAKHNNYILYPKTVCFQDNWENVTMGYLLYNSIVLMLVLKVVVTALRLWGKYPYSQMLYPKMF